jgi:N-methylhydantoinase B
MDHGRFGPQERWWRRRHGQGRHRFRGGEGTVPLHLSKEQDIPLAAGDRVRVGTPGGGGYGDRCAQPGTCLHDVAMGYYTAEGR